MARTNLQVRIPPETDAQIAVLSPTSKSAFVRQAIEEKVRRETFRRLEEQWIAALRKEPEDKDEVKRWLQAESWGPR